MEVRPDGIWGRVKWTASGAALLADQAYRGISPVFQHDAKGVVQRILRAALVNYPNLRGLVALHQETSMSFMAQLAEKLGLKADASEGDILGALPAAAGQTALQAQMAEIGVALGVTGGDATAIVAAARAKASAQPEEVTALQAQLTTVTTQLNALRDGALRDRATAFVDAAIQKGHVGVKPSRDRFIAMHMQDAAGAEDIIGKLPILGPSGTSLIPPAAADGTVSLNAGQRAVARATGRIPEEFAAMLAADAKAKENR